MELEWRIVFTFDDEHESSDEAIAEEIEAQLEEGVLPEQVTLSDEDDTIVRLSYTYELK